MPPREGPFETASQEDDHDPWKPFNEKSFTVNKQLDRFVLKPIATGYGWIMPGPLEKGIANAF